MGNASGRFEAVHPQMDIEAYLAQHQQKDLLRVFTAGSVDDGKSTLIGRLLHDTQVIFEDQLTALARDSVKHGTTGAGELDLALLMDGLKAEREQGITIDVAYRYFSTHRRKFIIADTPGHEQYTRNMATGASTADLAILLVDARKGVASQTKRHSFIVSLLGVQHVALCVNKMDLVDYSEEVFEEIRKAYVEFAVRLEFRDVHFFPISALRGDNVIERSERMPWYEGPPLLKHLEGVYVASDRNLIDFRFPVQMVLRPDHTFRGYAGTVASGTLRQGDEVMVLPSKRRSRIREIVTYDGSRSEAFPPLAVTLTLEDELDISRGDMLVRPANVPKVAREFEAMLVWMDDDAELQPGRDYLLKHTTNLVAGAVTYVRYRLDVHTLRRQSEVETLTLNDIGRVSISVARPLAFDPYRRNRNTGSFILIDRATNKTAAAGVILGTELAEEDEASGRIRSARASAVEPESGRLPRQRTTGPQREAALGQRPATLWLTGLPGAGKTSLAYALEQRLVQAGHAAVVLDPDGFEPEHARDLGLGERAATAPEPIRRVAALARLANDAGLIVIVSYVSPVEDDRTLARETLGPSRFHEIFVDTPKAVCEGRLPSLYARRDSEEPLFIPGITIPFEAPSNPALILDTATASPADCVQQLLQFLHSKGVLETE